jgi:hypothetical protein
MNWTLGAKFIGAKYSAGCEANVCKNGIVRVHIFECD